MPSLTDKYLMAKEVSNPLSEEVIKRGRDDPTPDQSCLRISGTSRFITNLIRPILAFVAAIFDVDFTDDICG